MKGSKAHRKENRTDDITIVRLYHAHDENAIKATADKRGVMLFVCLYTCAKPRDKQKIRPLGRIFLYL